MPSVNTTPMPSVVVFKKTKRGKDLVKQLVMLEARKQRKKKKAFISISTEELHYNYLFIHYVT